jgi:hypothetical protein
VILSRKLDRAKRYSEITELNGVARPYICQSAELSVGPLCPDGEYEFGSTNFFGEKINTPPPVPLLIGKQGDWYRLTHNCDTARMHFLTGSQDR